MRTLVALAAVTLAAPALAQEGGAKVYRSTVPSVVWVHSTRPNGLATGSGSLIDRDRKLVLTNFHVVEENPRATVFFPVFRDGQPVAEKSYYTDRAARLGVPGRVIALDKAADLAVIQLASVPDEAKGIPLAPASPDPGENVQSIGNTGKSGALWGFVKGTVRQVYRKKWKARLGANRVAEFEAKVVETDSATNPGDSGGPLLNDKGELVGVTQGGAVDAQLVSTFVDVSEVRQLLATRAVRDARGGSAAAVAEDPKLAKPVKRATPVTVRDEAKLFSADAVKAANEALAALHARGLDVLVETVPAAPPEWIEKAKKAAPDERKRLFREWAEERLKAEHANGFAVLVCLDPRYIAVEVPEAAADRLPAGFAKAAADALIAAFKEKKFDTGLADVLARTKTGLKGDGK